MKRKFLIFSALALLVTMWFVSSCDEILTNTAAPHRFSQVVPGLYRGGRLTDISLEKASLLMRQLEIKTILSLENEICEKLTGKVVKEGQWAEKLGIVFRRIPLNKFFPPEAAQVDQALAVVRNQSNWPLYIHCDYGEDRTGFVVGAYRVLVQGWAPEKAYEEMKRFGYSGLLYDMLGWHNAFFNYIRSRKGLRFPA